MQRNGKVATMFPGASGFFCNSIPAQSFGKDGRSEEANDRRGRGEGRRRLGQRRGTGGEQGEK
jgi:hypothetical protein